MDRKNRKALRANAHSRATHHHHRYRQSNCTESGHYEATSPTGERFPVECRQGGSIVSIDNPGNWTIEKVSELATQDNEQGQGAQQRSRRFGQRPELLSVGLQAEAGGVRDSRPAFLFVEGRVWCGREDSNLHGVTR